MAGVDRGRCTEGSWFRGAGPARTATTWRQASSIRGQLASGSVRARVTIQGRMGSCTSRQLEPGDRDDDASVSWLRQGLELPG